MPIVLTPFSQPKGEQTISHDLNFQSNRYESTHPFTFRNPKPELLDRLRESGPVGDNLASTNGNGVTGGAAGGKAAGASEKKRKTNKTQVDMEKLAEGLERLGEDDLLHVVQMVHDNKTDDTYTKNDVESENRPFPSLPCQSLSFMTDLFATDGEFHVDLYTLPDQLIKMLWDFVSSKVNMAELA